MITDKNVACSRSLTCKTHGVGAKRSVPGRSKAFDTLLTEFQKKKEHRIKQREKEAAKLEKNMGTSNALPQSADGSNISVPSINKPSFDDGDDIAVPQAGSSAPNQIRLLSPSPLNSIPVPSPTNMEDIQIQQPPQDLLQPSSQPTSRPQQSKATQQNQSLVASGMAIPPPVQQLQQQQTNPASNSTTSLPMKNKPNQIALSGGSNSTPSKGNAPMAGSANGAPVSLKKKKVGEGGKTGKNKTSARNKADLILGEVDDPPEPMNAGTASSTLIGADGNFIVEEEAPDSDDEVDQLLLATTQSRARPLALPTFPPYERTPMKLAKYRESFLTAFTGRSMSSSAS